MRRPPSMLLPVLALACGDDSNPMLESSDATSSTGASSGSGSSSGTTTDESSESGSESSTTGPMPCVGDEECTNVEAPFCGTAGECGTCDATTDPDGACFGADPLAPVCVGDTCVQCTEANPVACTGETPLCDDATNTCVPCTEHDQCGEAACNLYTGACLPMDAVVHVGPGQEFATLSSAVGSFPGMGAEGTIIVHEPMASYDESVIVDNGRVLAFLAANDAALPPRWILSAGGAPQLTVTTGSTALIDGLRMSGNADDVGLVVDGALAWVDRSRIVQNSGGGIVAQNAAEFTLRNCFIGSGGAVDTDAIALDGSSLDMLYSTVGGGAVISERTRALYCQGVVTATVRNSILVSLDAMPEVECPGVTLTDSATEADVGMLSSMWFVGYATGDFTLSASGAATFENIAQWATGDPPADIDGDLRPAIDGTPDYAGADVP